MTRLALSLAAIYVATRFLKDRPMSEVERLFDQLGDAIAVELNAGRSIPVLRYRMTPDRDMALDFPLTDANGPLVILPNG